MDTRPLAWQQAALFICLGAAILLTHGSIVTSPLYAPVGPWTMRIGAAQLVFGLLYGVALYYRIHWLHCGCAWVATTVWLCFAAFYFAGDLHRIGSITCFVLACSQIVEQLRPAAYKEEGLQKKNRPSVQPPPPPRQVHIENPLPPGWEHLGSVVYKPEKGH